MKGSVVSDVSRHDAGISIDKVDIEGVKNDSHIHMTGYEGSKTTRAYLSLLKRVKAETGGDRFVRSGLGSNREWNPQIKELFPYIDVLFMNGTEAIHYSEGEDRYRERHGEFAKECDRVVIKLGSSGSAAIENGKRVFLPGVPGKGCGLRLAQGIRLMRASYTDF